jgi:hypothetical protein
MNAPLRESPTAAPQPRTRSRTPHNVLIAIGITVIALPIVLVGLVIISMSIQDAQRVSVGDAFSATGRYYQALQRGDYATAYTYVDQHATVTIDGRATILGSADALAATARARDLRDGAVTAYTLTDGAFEQGKDVVDLTVHVTRVTSEYDVRIQIKWVGGNQVMVDKGKWTILQADGM